LSRKVEKLLDLDILSNFFDFPAPKCLSNLINVMLALRKNRYFLRREAIEGQNLLFSQEKITDFLKTKTQI
jgi:hypothetical protein